MDTQYKTQAKHLYEVLLRIQRWFKGEDLLETVVVPGSDDSPYDFMWSHEKGGFFYLSDEKWLRVLNVRHVEPMIFCMSKVEQILEEARERRDAIADLAAMASEQGEDLLLRLSEFVQESDTFENL